MENKTRNREKSRVKNFKMFTGIGLNDQRNRQQVPGCKERCVDLVHVLTKEVPNCKLSQKVTSSVSTCPTEPKLSRSIQVCTWTQVSANKSLTHLTNRICLCRVHHHTANLKFPHDGNQRPFSRLKRNYLSILLFPKSCMPDQQVGMFTMIVKS